MQTHKEKIKELVLDILESIIKADKDCHKIFRVIQDGIKKIDDYLDENFVDDQTQKDYTIKGG